MAHCKALFRLCRKPSSIWFSNHTEFLLFALLIISARLAVVCLRRCREGHAIAFFGKNHCLESTKLLSRKSNLVVPITSQKAPSGGSATDSRQSRDSQVLRCGGAGRPWPTRARTHKFNVVGRRPFRCVFRTPVGHRVRSEKCQRTKPLAR